MTALAELDAAKSAKPDTSAADGLKQQLATKEEELAAIKTQLTATEEEFTNAKGDLDLATKDLDAYRAEADAKHKTAQADYQDLNDSMTALVEDGEKKRKELAEKLDEVQIQVEKQERDIDELHAQLKVKDAEIVEAKVRPR